MAGTPVIRTTPLVSYSYTGSGGAFNILYTNSAYIKLSTGFASGAAQAANTGIMVLGSSISKTIANTTLKGPDHCSVIANSIFPVTTVAGAFGIKVNGGPIWNHSTSLTNNGGWKQAIADPTATPSGTPLGGSGTALSIGTNVTNISMHMDQTYTGSAENMFEGGGMAGSWIGKEISVDGGTSTVGNEITFQSISDQDRSQTFNNASPFTGLFLGHVEISGGVSRLNAPVQIGNADGVTVTHMLEKNTTLEWTDNPVNLKFYRLDFIGAATTIIWGDSASPAPVSISCAGTTNRWALNTATQIPAAFTLYGDNLKDGRAWTLGSNSIFDGGLWQDVTDVAMDALTQVLNKQLIAVRLDYGLPPVAGKLTGTTFASPVDYCMTIATQTANMTVDYEIKASARGAGKAINFTHTSGNILVTAAAGYYQPVAADVTVSGAGTVSFASGVTVTFGKMKDLSEVWVYTTGTFTQLAYIEDAVAGTVDNRSFSWSQPAGTVVDYVVFNKLYEVISIIGFTVPTTATTIDMNQRFDRNFA